MDGAPSESRFPPIGPDWSAFSASLLAATFEGEFLRRHARYAGSAWRATLGAQGTSAVGTNRNMSRSFRNSLSSVKAETMMLRI